MNLDPIPAEGDFSFIADETERMVYEDLFTAITQAEGTRKRWQRQTLSSNLHDPFKNRSYRSHRCLPGWAAFVKERRPSQLS